MSDAKWLYYWGNGVKLDSNKHQIWMSGTPVVIQGMFNYDRHYGPWFDLKNNKDGRLKLSGDPMDVEEVRIPIQQIPEEIRSWIPNRQRYVSAEDTLRARGIIGDDVHLTASINFNKRRREKKARALKDSLSKLGNEPPKSSTDIELIKKKLEELEGEKIKIIEQDSSGKNK
jgi:hypothetical protein